MDIVLVLLILALIVVGVLIFLNGNSKDIKSPTVKKHEIIQQYEKELNTILNRYKNDNETKIKEKKLFLQKCSSELSRNIFFNPDESKKIIQNLASL